MRNDFLAGRGASASQGAAARLDALLAPAALETAPASASAPSSSAAELPIGMRVEQAARDAAAPIGANVAGAWDQLRSDWQASHPDLSNYPSGFWDQMKAQRDRHLAVGKLPLDAFNLAMAPVSGAIDAGISKPLGWVLDKLTPPGTPAGEGEKAVNQALLALGPKVASAPPSARRPKREPAPRILPRIRPGRRRS